jgi:hypothetical protein
MMAVSFMQSISAQKYVPIFPLLDSDMNNVGW